MKRRTNNLDRLRYSYKLSESGHFGLDVLISEQLDFDEKSMSAWIPFANGNRRDSIGDLLEVEGIYTDRHRQNPIVLFDHGKRVQLPIGLTEDTTGNYTVTIDPVARAAKANCFFYQGKALVGVDRTAQYDHAIFCEQLFDLLVKRYLRAGSIGYQVLKANPLHLDVSATGLLPSNASPGMHLLATRLLEVSLVVLPANADTVRKVLGMNRLCGKMLSPVLVKSLTPYAEKSMPSTVNSDKPDDEIFDDSEITDEEEVAEPYGAQVLRRIHEDSTILLEDYDEMLQVLENDAVKTHLGQLLEQLTATVEATEDLFSGNYADLPGLEGTEEESIEDESVENDETIPADSEQPEEPSPDEVIEGMKKEGKSYRSKADDKFGRRYNGALDWVKEQYPQDSEDEQKRKAEAIAQGPERKSLWRKKLKSLRAKYRKEMCPVCKASPCMCKKEEAKSEMVETKMADGKLDNHEIRAVKAGTGFLRSLVDVQDWADDHRLESFFHGKTFEGIIGVPRKVKLAPAVAAAIGGAAGYLSNLGKSAEFGDGHRKEAAQWHRSLEPITKEGEEPQEEQTNPHEEFAKSLAETFRKQNLEIAELEKQMAKIRHCLETINV